MGPYEVPEVWEVARLREIGAEGERGRIGLVRGVSPTPPGTPFRPPWGCELEECVCECACACCCPCLREEKSEGYL